MPEMTECTALTRILKEFVTFLTSFTTLGLLGLKVYNLWADPTDTDVQDALKDPSELNIRTRARLTERLSPTSDFTRGGRSEITRRKLVPPADVLDAIGGKVENLTLLSVEGNPRNIILRFDHCYCQIQLYTHVLPLICSLDDYYNVLCKIPKEFRRYKVGLAIELAQFVIVFTTLDLLIGVSTFSFSSSRPPARETSTLTLHSHYQVHWAVQANALPTDHIDIYKTPEQYIACLLHWIKQRRDSSLKLRKQAVATLVRRECHVFAGVGVYTVCEVFFIAGLSLLMTEEELFTDESRVGRLFGAMYTWGHLAHTAHSEFVCTVVVNWKICPTFKEKQRWYRFMNVQCKDRAPSSVRKQVLHKRFVQGVAAGERHSRLHDVFEPTDIQTALVDIPELCDPIFGSKADQFKMEIKASDVRQTQTLLPELARILLDQFIPFFRKGLGAFKMASQSLDLSMYDTFFLPTSEIQGKERRLKTILLKIDGKFAWTVLPPTICQLKASDSTMSSQLQFGPQRQAVLSHGTSRTLSRDEEASDSSDTDTFESEMPVVTTRQSASSNNAKGKGKGKVSQGFHKFGAGRRSAIVICDEKLRTKNFILSSMKTVLSTIPVPSILLGHHIAYLGLVQTMMMIL